MKFPVTTILLAVSLALAATVVHATTLVRMSLVQMSRASREIVRARCVGNTTTWDVGEIWTFTTFDIEETWRGSARGRISVRLLGGAIGSLTSHVSGIPRFQPGEQVVLFLEPATRGDFSIVSWQQGTFRIARQFASDGTAAGEFVMQDSASFGTFDPSTRRFAETGIRNMPLAAFHAQIAAALAHAATNTNAPGEHP
jgi:hypothetical protein